MILDQFKLDGKLALVSGCRRGIGRALMRRLLDPFPAVRQIVLICEDTADTRGFYRACGFESLASLGCAGYVQFR